MNETFNSYKNWKNELEIVKNIEGLLVPGQEKALMIIASKLPENATVVEIGSFKGKSTACLGLGSPKSAKIYAIDTFEGNNRDFIEGIQFINSSFFEEFKKNLINAHVWRKIRPKIGYSHKIGKTWNKPIDFLFIDGSHLYEDVKKDFELFYPWVKNGGIIAFHDVSPGFPGVKKIWTEKVQKRLSCHSNIFTLYFGTKPSNLKNKLSDVRLINSIKDESITKKVYVILPIFNRLAYTIKCLNSIEKQTYKNIEVIVIDDGSTDGTSAYIKRKYPRCRIIKGNGKWFWTKSMYEGVKMATYSSEPEDFILTMNNDCFFHENYIRNLVKSSQDNYRAIVGSYILDAKNPKKVVDAGVIINWRQSHIYGLSERIAETTSFFKDKNTIVGIDTLPGKGTLIPIEVFNKIGNFNYILLPHYIGDFEFFCRAKRNGFNLIVSTKSKIYNYSKETGSEHGNFHHKASYKDVFKVLFSRKSKVNIVDHFFFLILCCPKRYWLQNFKNWFLKFINYLLLLFPFYYIKVIINIYNKTLYVTKVFFHNVPILIRQNQLLNNLIRAGFLFNQKQPVSYGYSLSSKKEAVSLNKAWLKRELPKRQMEIVTPLLDKRMIPDIAKPVIKILKRLKKNLNILDVGCSGGYYYDFFKYSRLDVKYQGCDFSPHFISLAKKLHPDIKFKIGNITKLPYKDNEFDIVLASGILEFEINYKKALSELARVSSRHIIIHRLPVFDSIPQTKFFTKIGYGFKMGEIVFGQKELNKLFEKHKLKVISNTKHGQVDINHLNIGKASCVTILLKKSKSSRNVIKNIRSVEL